MEVIDVIEPAEVAAAAPEAPRTSPVGHPQAAGAPVPPAISINGRHGAATEAPAEAAQGLVSAAGGSEAEAAAEAAAVAAASKEPYALVEKVPLAGGVLDIVRLEGDRMLRIWMPPGYSLAEAARHPYPLLVLNDGQNLFDDAMSFSGSSWRAGGTAAKLISRGQLPPFLILGTDHSGPMRSFDYLPYKPGTGPGGFRKDAADWPGGGVATYLDRVFNEIIPWVAGSYGAATDKDLVAFGGSSFGGICTLYACMHYGDRFGAALVESPSLWFADEKFLREDVEGYEGDWPGRVFLAMGSKEYSGIRPAPGPRWDQLLVSYCEELAGYFASRGLDDARLKWQISEGATHSESDWARRLPAALSFILQPWWAPVLRRNGDSLFFTTPRKLQAGQPAVLFVNRPKSHVLSSHTGLVSANIAFNNWTNCIGERQMQFASQFEAEAASGASGWQSASFTVPPDAYEMNFAMTDGKGTWDNNGGFNFYLPVRRPSASLQAPRTPEEAVALATAAAEGPADEVAARSGSKLYFSTPEVLVAGASARLYFNRARSEPLRNNPNVKVHLGFNHWEVGCQDLQLAPTTLWRENGVEWWATQPIQVPEGAFDFSFAFTDGHGAWDSNDGHNYSAPVSKPSVDPGAAPRGVASVEVIDHAGGKLHIIQLTKRSIVDKASKESRWKEEKVLRVWTPPGWSKEAAPPGGWPVLWMNDGSNMFEDWLAHQGHAWNVGYCAAGLIANGSVPPFVVAAVDSAGPMRSLNYLPYKPGTGTGGFRGDAERWPGGGCEGYMRRLVTELVPLVTTEFSTASDPSKVAFGGGSFAGVTALYAAMHYPHVFGAVLAESPSLWIAEGAFLRDMWNFRGRLPERVFIGCGTREYSATRDHDREEIDALLLRYGEEAAKALEAAGMRGPQRLYFQVEEGAGHHELAWSWRLSGALTFLLSPWWDE